MVTPHLDKLNAAIHNPKCPEEDRLLLKVTKERYKDWRKQVTDLSDSGKERVKQLTQLLNIYKNFLEVETIACKGSEFLKQQKWRLKLDSSVIEEFLCDLVHPEILKGLPDTSLEIDPETIFLSPAFSLSDIAILNETPTLEPVHDLLSKRIVS